MDLEIITVAAAVGLSAIWILLIMIYYKRCFAPYQVLKKCGIKGPMPVPIIGNFIIFKMNFREISQHLYDTYYKEPVIGIYFGRRPTIYIKDPEMIKQITTVKFECFVDRPHKVPIAPDEYAVGGLAAAKGEAWRSMRRMVSPAFSASKLRMIVPLIERSIDILIVRFGEVANSGRSINILEFYSTFTLETILAAAFGRIVDIQRGKAEELKLASLKACDLKQDRMVMSCIKLLMVMPCLKKLVHWFLWRKHALSWKMMKDIAFQVVESRRDKQKFKDVLQLMIEGSTSAGVDIEDRSEKGCPIGMSNETSNHNFSASDILDNVVMFLFDETSKNTLAHISYLLAINPDIQLKLQDAIDAFYRENPEAKLYEAAEKINYLDYAIQESLRLYPPAVTISRLCVTPAVIGGVDIPRGTHVHIPIKQLHYDIKYWNNPKKFDPQRFSPQEKAKRPSSVHLPFGMGPRNCIGKRLALLETKMTLIKILQRYSFVQGPETKVPLPIPDGFGSCPAEGIFIRVVRNRLPCRQ